MKNSLCAALVLVINALFHLTLANPYSQSYRGHAGDGYPDSSGSYVTNFGNGNNKRNFVNMNESPDGLSISGASFSNDETGRPSVQKINVDFNNPNYRGGPQDPNVNWNPRATRTQVTNIGNGEGNRNLFVFHDNRHNEPYPRNNQDGNNGYQGETSYGHQGNTRVITNIGKGPDNDNRFYVNGKRVYPNAVNRNGGQDPSVTHDSIPSANSNGQSPQNAGGVTNNNFNEPKGATSNHATRNQAPTHNGYSTNNYPTHNYNQVKIINSNFPAIINDPFLKELPMRD